jgi:hypothetical protein
MEAAAGGGLVLVQDIVEFLTEKSTLCHTLTIFTVDLEVFAALAEGLRGTPFPAINESI